MVTVKKRTTTTGHTLARLMIAMRAAEVPGSSSVEVDAAAAETSSQISSTNLSPDTKRGV